MFENLILLNKYTLKFQKSEIEKCIIKINMGIYERLSELI
jgi:hypothetical protein